MVYSVVRNIILSRLAMSQSTLEYASGMGPGKQVSGTSGEYSRYRSVFIRPPTDDDRSHSLTIANKVRCDVCEEILKELLPKAQSLAHIDDILDVLESPIDEDTWEKSTDPQVNRINLSRTGCNKHFKDSLLARGHTHARQSLSPLCPPGFHAGPCDDKRTGYNRDYDALYYACEATIGRYGDDIAEYLANNHHVHHDLQQQRTSHVELGPTIRAVCRDVGKCNMHRRRPRNQPRDMSAMTEASHEDLYRRRGTGNTSKATDRGSTVPDATSQEQPADGSDTADSAGCGIAVPMDRRDWIVRYNEGLLRSERSTKAAALQRQLHVQDLRYERFLTSLEDDTIDAQTSLDGILRPQLPSRQKRVRSCRTRKEAAALSHKTARRC
ncbi:hypothetical protein FOZ60_011763 [Perkinsus olseni]|uniref:Uncharacterized protein n=1 Tax=Perkinsus olseni TaxID=32597 RepID=A0A7J6PNA7_PEROL|nr:hypothetical protein FOZ60_011763 [Perkinsus olseni]